MIVLEFRVKSERESDERESDERRSTLCFFLRAESEEEEEEEEESREGSYQPNVTHCHVSYYFPMAFGIYLGGNWVPDGNIVVGNNVYYCI